MNALKLINIFLLALVLTLVMQMFLPKAPEQVPSEGNYVSVKSDSVVIPNLPEIHYHNTSSGSVDIHPCDDIKIAINSQEVTGIQQKVNCDMITVAPNSNFKFDISGLHQTFSSYAGQYIFTLQQGDSKPLSVFFKVEKPGIFRSFVSSVIYEPIYNFFVGILTILPGHELGWAIIIITIIIRLILLVPQNKMLESSRKMNQINPKIQALKKEYKDDQATLGMKMMELYKKEGINPAGSCFPILIQFPILIGLYWVVSGINDVSNFYHLYSFFKDFNPSSINSYFFGVDLSLQGGLFSVIAAIILGVTQWAQVYLSFQYNPTSKKKTEKKEKKEKKKEGEMPQFDPQMMQKVMLYFFPLMLAGSSLFFPLGVGLYWFIGTLFIIVQQWYVYRKGDKKSKKGEIVKK